MGVRKKHGVKALTEVLAAVENKRKGITGDAEKVRRDLQMIMEVIDNPVPDRRIKDYE